MLLKFHKEQEGGIVLEASLILPLFLAFVVGLVLFIRIALVEMALQSGVSEATKSIAGQLYPVRILVQEAQSKYDQSRAAEMFNSVVDGVQSARNHVTSTEEIANEYAAYIPDSLLELVRWEKEKRELGEGMAQDELNEFYHTQVKPRMLAVFTPIVFAFCDEKIVDKRNFKVISVTLPSLNQDGEAFFGMEAQLIYKLPIPFMSQTIVLKKRAYERAWVGA
ncbi:TadE family protein [Paenibacillus qinlingensis]|uniref:TadE family protein n=1 Tax=Paenibacillus qinlingensis TaxID=1837343 RepID=UPI00156430D0|nr:TadE family protein [Paenibacillus qinlingensis]NQX63274.1 pilus assembly protein [Paenibacillus qinlingensis]